MPNPLSDLERRYKAMKRKILTNLAVLSLLVSVVSTQGSFRGPEYGGDYGHDYGYSTYGYPTLWVRAVNRRSGIRRCSVGLRL